MTMCNHFDNATLTLHEMGFTDDVLNLHAIETYCTYFYKHNRHPNLWLTGKPDSSLASNNENE
jgi:hypothetical protein